MSVCGLQYSLQISGDCNNSGSGGFTLSITGNAPDYVIQYISPTTDVVYLGNGVTEYTTNSLSSGTYVFEIYDACVISDPSLVSLFISSGTSVTCTGIQNTNNSLRNGAITAQTSTIFGTPLFYLYDETNGYIKSGSSVVNSFIFQNLSGGTYYVIGNDGGGCTGRSESVIIKSSSTFNFGFYIVDDSGCGRNTGKVFVTGLTGNDPYTYLWGNGATTSSISGLTSGNYRVTVTDKDGVVVTKQATVNSVPKLGYVNAVITPPSCYADDGTINFIISGGTAPYNYELSNGEASVSFLQNIVIPNVTSGYYTMTVTDAGSCVIRQKFSVLAPKGFSVVSINKRNTICGTNQGLIQIQLVGGSPNYTYVLTDENNKQVTFTSSSPSQVFSNLYSGVYTLNISDLGPCTYSEVIEIESTTSFSINYEVTDTTCDNEFGSVTVEILGDGLPPYTYMLSGQPKVTKNSKTNTFSNLKEGTYLLSVTDSSGCTENQNLSVNSTTKLNFNLFTQKTKSGNDGKIDLYITDGTPPFTVTWGDNVSEQTGTTISNLSAGTYSVTVSDANGCTQYRTANVDGQNLISSYQTYNICNSNIVDSGEVTKKGLQQMLSEGFYDLTIGDNNCVLNQAIFTAIVNLSGVTTSTSFYTTESLNDFPPDNDFYNVVEQILSSIPGIDNVIFNSNTNQVTINTGCQNQTISLQDFDITVSVNINYDITCQSCGGTSIPASYPLVVTDSSIYGFDPENGTFVSLPQSDEYTNALGIAINSSETKLWVLNIDGQTIFEYDVNSLVPYDIEYNRSITLSSTVSRDLISIDSTTLYSANDNSSYLASIDITNGNITNGIFLSVIPFTVVNYSMLINSLNNIIVITNDIDGFLYLRQYDKTGPLQVEISLPATVGYTMYEHNSVFYLVDLGNYQVYSILTSSPYTLTPEFTIDPPVTTNIFIMSQINTYVTTNFT